MNPVSRTLHGNHSTVVQPRIHPGAVTQSLPKHPIRTVSVPGGLALGLVRMLESSG
ncbi:MAG: hypothetical protein V1796_04490 [Pseudomonadota bacterium]